MHRLFVYFALSLSIASISLQAQAHRAWILPAATTLSGDDPWVSFDAAISNDIFHADYHAMGLENLSVTGPEGAVVELQNPHKGKHRSNFDLNLSVPGTYKVFTARQGLTATWETDEGERKRWPGRGEQPDPAEFATAVPEHAKNLKVTQSSRRIETFVTSGGPSTGVLKVTGIGLEMEPITHPNDLYAGESASFRLLIDGEPAVGASVSVIPGGMRYRQGQAEMKLESDARGEVNIRWPEAGMYFMEAEYTDSQAPEPATSRSGVYVATFEVLPQ